MGEPLLLKPGSDLLSHGECHTTIGAGAFHFRVRDGIGWYHTAIAARQTGLQRDPPLRGLAFAIRRSSQERDCVIVTVLFERFLVLYDQAARAISTG